jgi:hypothetical protein
MRDDAYSTDDLTDEELRLEALEDERDYVIDLVAELEDEIDALDPRHPLYPIAIDQLRAALREANRRLESFVSGPDGFELERLASRVRGASRRRDNEQSLQLAL